MCFFQMLWVSFFVCHKNNPATIESIEHTFIPIYTCARVSVRHDNGLIIPGFGEDGWKCNEDDVEIQCNSGCCGSIYEKGEFACVCVLNLWCGCGCHTLQFLRPSSHNPGLDTFDAPLRLLARPLSQMPGHLPVAQCLKHPTRHHKAPRACELS